MVKVSIGHLAAIPRVETVTFLSLFLAQLYPTMSQDLEVIIPQSFLQVEYDCGIGAENNNHY